jgi:pimeloyl-ACP methyl ester carboxylesterase
MRGRGTIVLITVLVMATGCGPRKLPEAVIVPPCDEPTLADRGVAYPNAAGAKLTGYLLGTGRVGVVLAAQAGHDACDWLPYARQLADRGYRVLAGNYTGEGGSSYVDGAAPSADLLAAITELRGTGVTTVALIGASRGGTAALIAATVATPPVNAVVSLSAPGTYGGEDAFAVVPRLTVPVLYLVAERDGTFPAAAKLLHDATPGADRRLVSVPGSRHGASLVVGGSENDEAARAVTAFLSRYAPP